MGDAPESEGLNFEEESYVRLYVRDTLTGKRLGFEGRAVLWHLMRVADRSGFIEVGEGDLVEAITILLGDVPEAVISTDFREKIVRKGEAPWLSSMLCRFIETVAKRVTEKPAAPIERYETPEGEEDPDQRAARAAFPEDYVLVNGRWQRTYALQLGLPARHPPKNRNDPLKQR